MEKFQLNCEQSLLLVVDVQERLVPAVQSDTAESLLPNISILLQAAQLFQVPTIVTEQYPRGLGHTVDALQTLLPGQTYWKKTTFSCMQDDAVRTHLKELDRPQVVLCGIEAHVCVLQTALDLLKDGYNVHIMSDAVGSRTEKNRKIGLHLAQSAGGIVSSTETAVFQWAKHSKHDAFKVLSRLVR